MDFPSYQDKRVIVTGCSSGIGQATAHALAGLGAEVHGVDRAQPAVDLASFELLDLTEPATIHTAVRQIGGRVDALFNCAGAPPMLASPEVLKVNFLGPRLLTELVTELMPPGGAIVSASSNAGFGWRRQLPLLLEFVATDTVDGGLAWYAKHEDAAGQAYAFSKSALNVWTMQQSAVLIRRGIRINTASPGAVQTPMLEAIEAAYPAESIKATTYPVNRRSTPEEQAGVLLFLNSDGASYVNGADLAVDGGYWAALSVAGKLWD